MPLVINTNVSALNSQRQLVKSGSELDQAMERLSSGKRVNTAADDAAGLAIANRMTSQIRGLSQAIRNANDGVSMIQTAEGALDETTNILQRMRELSIQAANGIYSDADRSTLDAEVQQLKAELDRIAESTTFNGQPLLDGSLGDVTLQVGAEEGDTIDLSITAMDTQTLGGGISGDVIGANMASSTTSIAAIGDLVNGGSSGTISINGQNVGDLTAAANLEDILSAFNENVSGVETSSFLDMTASTDGTGILRGADTLTLTMQDLEGNNQVYIIGETGSMNELVEKIEDVTGGVISASVDDDNRLSLTSTDAAQVTVSYQGSATAANVGFGSGEVYRTNLAFTITDSSIENVQIDITATDVAAETLIAYNFGIQERGTGTAASDITGNGIAAGAAVVEGDLVINGVAMSGTTAGTAVSDQAANLATMINAQSDESGVVATVSASGTDAFLVLNSVDGSEMSIEFAGTTATLGATGLIETNVASASGDSVAGISIDTIDGATAALDVIDAALEEINAIRADLGAINNRLEFTMSNLSNVVENTAASRSRIMDADFAAETSELSRAQVLQQASQAMLAQANARPQQVLSLLQG